jgi:hypothetical protein
VDGFASPKRLQPRRRDEAGQDAKRIIFNLQAELGNNTAFSPDSNDQAPLKARQDIQFGH